MSDGQWQISSPTTGDTPLRSKVLVDAWMHNPDVRRNADPLALSLEDADRVRPFNDYSVDGTAAPTGSPKLIRQPDFWFTPTATSIRACT